MNKLRNIVIGAVAVILFTLISITACPAQVDTVLHSFGDGSNPNDVISPTTALIQGGDGNFYGTTSNGGTAGLGTIYRISPQGVVTILHSFGDGTVTNDGLQPQTSLVQATDGNFYGTTEFGGTSGNGTSGSGAGVLFKITAQGAYSIAHDFGSVTNDAAQPTVALMQSSDGGIYGSGNGSIFKYTLDGGYSIVLTGYQCSRLTEDTAGNLHATLSQYYYTYPYSAPGNPPPTNQTVFGFLQISPQGIPTISTLTGFSGATVPAGPCDGLTQDQRGFVYGTTALSLTLVAKPYGAGFFDSYTVTNLGSVIIDGSGNIRYTFGSQLNDGSSPAGSLALGSDGYLYGVTTSGGASVSSGGIIYSLKNGYTILHDFNDGSVTNDGSNPQSGLTRGSDGRLYGVTPNGGSAGLGVFYAFDPAASAMITPSSLSGTAYVPFSFQVRATNFPTHFAADHLPNGLAIDPTNGVISGTPTTPQTVTASVAITSESGEVSHFPVTISIAALLPPIVTSPLTSGGTVGKVYNYIVTAVDSPTGFTSISSNLLPPGLTFDSTSGVISGTPTAPGTFQIPLTPINNAGPGTTSTLTITVFASRTPFSEEVVPYQFNSPPSGVKGLDGFYYSMTTTDGSNNAGTLTKTSARGVSSTVTNFYSSQTGGLILDAFFLASDGNFYGSLVSTSTFVGQQGEIFRVTPSGEFTILYVFHYVGELLFPVGLPAVATNVRFIEGKDGNFYGTSSVGGEFGDGELFRLTKLGVYTRLLDFKGPRTGGQSGAEPIGLMQASDGTFYGITLYGGTAPIGDGPVYGSGTIYSYSLTYGYNVLHNCDFTNSATHDYSPTTPPFEGSDGNLYGYIQTDSADYSGSVGLLYKLSVQSSGTPAVYSVISTDGSGLLQAVDGNFYYSSSNAIIQLIPVNGGSSYTSTPIVDTTGYLIETPDGNLLLYPQTAILTQFVAAIPPAIIGSTVGVEAVNSPATFGLSAIHTESFGTTLTGSLVKPKPTTAWANIVSAITSLISGSTSAPLATTADVWSLFDLQGNSDPPLPPNMIFNHTNGIISGTAQAVPGTYQYHILASNLFGPSSQETLTLYVDSAPVTTKNVISDNAPPNAYYSYDLAVSGVIYPISLSSSDSPSWLGMGSSGIGGTPPGPGKYIFHVVAGNILGDTPFQVSLGIQPLTSTDPQITSSTTAEGTTNAGFNYPIAANYMPDTPVDNSYSALGLPPGLYCNRSTGQISGLPTTAGNYHVVISATNTSSTYTSYVDVTINSTSAPAIASALNASATQGVPFLYSIPVTGIVSTYSSDLAANSDISLDSLTGIISGIPTTVGIRIIHVTVANVTGSSSTTIYLNVVGATDFSSWEKSHSGFNGSSAATPLHDGIPNLLKYVYDIDPTRAMIASDQTALPTLGTVFSNGTKYLTLTFREFQGLSGVSVNVESSPDLVNWSSTGARIAEINTAANGDPIMQAQVPITAQRQFIHLKVTPP